MLWMVFCLVAVLGLVTPACDDDPGSSDPPGNKSSGGGGGGGGDGGTVASGDATSFDITTSWGAGNPDIATVYQITITALQNDGVTVADGYTGTIRFEEYKCGDTALGAVELPAGYTFDAADAGVQTFDVTFTESGTYNIQVYDISATGVQGWLQDVTICPGGLCPNPVDDLEIEVNPEEVIVSSTTSITTTVLDAADNPIPEACVLYEVSNSNASVNPVLDVADGNGVSMGTFYAPGSRGYVTVTVTSGAIVEEVYIQVNSIQAAGIEFISAVPKDIGVIGSGNPTDATVTFKVVDINGDPVTNSYDMIFESEGPVGLYHEPSVAPTVDGRASTTIHAGRVSGPVRVTAKVVVDNPFGSGTIDLIASISEIYVHAGVPNYEGFSIAVDFGTRNLPGLSIYGVTSTITTFVRDRFTNPVTEDTIVYFASEAGIIKASQTPTNELGQATTVLETAGPAPWDTAWEWPYNGHEWPYGEYWVGTIDAPGAVPTVAHPFEPGLNIVSDVVRDQYDQEHGGTPPYPYHGGYHIPNPYDGRSTVIAMTIGEEMYSDNNNNGIYDAGDLHTDVGEPYIDANENGRWDPGEKYWDVQDGNGEYTGPNGSWDDNIWIWTATPFLFTSEPGGIAWKAPGDQPCLTVDWDGDTATEPTGGPSCWVDNWDVLWDEGAGWVNLATDGNGMFDVPPDRCVAFQVVFCDMYHNPVSQYFIDEFNISYKGNMIVTPDTIVNSAFESCHYYFSACDDGDPDAASITFGGGNYSISVPGRTQ